MQEKINLAEVDVDEINNSYHFDDLHPPLSTLEAQVESARCLFCYDAPCIDACPTGINIPSFIRKISANNPIGAAKTILQDNILGGSCARVCPTETLCQQACVRNKEPECQPIQIGLLQRYAVDSLAGAPYPFNRKPATNKQIAVVGAGPAGLACAHQLAQHGHTIDLFEAKAKPGGLNEYGIAAYKLINDYAQQEVDKILAIGGIKLHTNLTLGVDFHLNELQESYDAVFLAIGLANSRQLGLEGEDHPQVIDAIEYIEQIRQQNLKVLPTNKTALVIGGGNTAIDIAVQLKKLGAKEVTVAYRRGREQMGATEKEQHLALLHGIKIIPWVKPVKIITDKKQLLAIELEHTQLTKGKLQGNGEFLIVPTDYIFKAIGQSLADTAFSHDAQLYVEHEQGKIKILNNYQTSLDKVFAGGDCINPGEDLTVTAVQQGKQAAQAIHQFLIAKEEE
ncbi:NAD(P)-dependent oxidoreductase [Spartinivicinus poritis]|uniref:dihydrouracil dehydrogenase (NAD(+)) n=1 Tax=Spartinivicinus poritis TaxID=2994640 RepID=A0ABT5U2Q8_9GAMM|nr:NAD(P)-dependent oxidoreductase [Spartinivicinus sp. A2-2]MDE1460646.1 NAD(P)-dependent oxidoreductase [Spartinivicinus sp. A2-2]